MYRLSNHNADEALSCSSSSNSDSFMTDQRGPGAHPVHGLVVTDLLMSPIVAEVTEDPEELIAAALEREQTNRNGAMFDALARQANTIPRGEEVQKPSASRKHHWLCLLLVVVVGVATTTLVVTLTRPPSSPPPPQQKRPQGTLRPVETPAPKIPAEDAVEESWNQLGGDLLGSNLGGAFGKFVTLSSDGRRLAVTSTAAERTSVSLFELGSDGESYESLYERSHKESYFGAQSPYYATVSGDGNYFVVAATYDGLETLTHQVQFLDFSQGAASGRPALHLSGLYDVYYGRPVAVSRSAQYVAVGIDGWQTGGKSLVQVYNDTQHGWQQVGSDIVGDGAFSEFGNTVCISSDGSVVAVADRSKFRVFEIDSGDWKWMGGTDTDTHSGGVERIALSSDGKTIAVSGDGVRVHRFQGKEWVQLGGTIEADTDYQYYNLDRVAMSGDGLTLATGTDNADSADASDHVIGYVRVYRLLDGEWQQIGERIDGAKSSEAFGASLSLTDDGSRLAVAAPGNEEYSATVGAVRVYDLA
jgi:hypothetical protein